MLSVFDHGAPPPCPTPFNMARYVLAAGRDTPDKVALVLAGPAGAEHWSFAQIERTVLGLATGLLAQGLVAGDRVLLRLGNSVDFPLAYLACIAVGLVPVPTSSQLTSGECDVLAAVIGPALILAQPGVALPTMPGCAVLSVDEMRALWAGPPAPYDLGDPERLAYIVFTSGTGGTPRAVAHAHRAIWARRMMWNAWYGLRAGDRMLHAGAFNWTYTLGTGLLDPWACGATAIIPTDGTAIEALPALIARETATLFAASPGVYRRILRADLPAMPSLRHGLSAGEHLPDDTRQAWHAATDTQVFEAYGMTECSTFLSSGPDGARPVTPQNGRKIAILGADGPCELGEAGAIAIAQGDQGLMLGYLDADGSTDCPVTDGWFLTGDTGAMAEGGQITYLGRADDVMNAGGVRVSPVEVEGVIGAFAGIDEIGVAAVRVTDQVQVIAAFYTSEFNIDIAALKTHAATHLARYKQPRIYIQLTALPRGANGKLLRAKLRTDFEEHDGKA